MLGHLHLPTTKMILFEISYNQITLYFRTMNLLDLFLQYKNISTDTRQIEPNSLFFALRGANFNGNDFALQALQQGAKYAIVDDEKLKNESNCIYVDNVLTALQNVAMEYRKTFTLPVIGLTGTNGKTTTKELIVNVLKQKMNVHSTKGNLNNHIGVPLTLLSANSNVDIMVIEMGASKIGDIDELVHIVLPTHGLITNCGTAHIEGFGSAENIKQAKGELYDFLKQHDGIVFRNTEFDYLQKRLGTYQKQITYGFTGYEDFTFSKKENRFFAEIEFQKNEIKSHLFGLYNSHNIITAMTVGMYFGLTIDQVKHGIETYQPDNNRSQIIDRGNVKIIADCYNANPSSMQEAISAFGKLNEPNKIVVLGDMLELGESSFSAHKQIIDLCQSLPFKQCYFIGKQFMQHQTVPFHFYENTQALKQDFCFDTSAWYLVKGSRGIGLEQLLQ